MDEQTQRRAALAEALASCATELQLFGSGEELQNALAEVPPSAGCLVCNLRLPGISGMELRGWLLRQSFRLPTIFFADKVTVVTAVEAMKLGAAEVLESPLALDRLPQLVTQLLERELQAHAKIARVGVFPAALASLTPRERLVMELLATGANSKEVAARLKISVKTVFVHRARVMQKLRVDNLVQLTILLEANQHEVDPASGAPQAQRRLMQMQLI
ncbi:MAG TPA: LuxR C-terminal-related transcriptional regulator [Pirellulaceae bacterium]|nr:LuxR C-terminal-related transcriptional regulator [Pirellulaceae bacterium]